MPRGKPSTREMRIHLIPLRTVGLLAFFGMMAFTCAGESGVRPEGAPKGQNRSDSQGLGQRTNSHTQGTLATDKSRGATRDSRKTLEVAPGQAPSNAKARLIENYGKLPLSFEPNLGQVRQDGQGKVKFISRGRGYSLFLTGNEAVLGLSKSAAPDGSARRPDPRNPSANASAAKTDYVRMKLVGANPTPNITGVEELPGKSNYFIGNDPKAWHTDVPNFAKVKYKNVYPGVDLIYYGNQGQLEFDWVVQPGVNPSAITLDIGAGLASPLRIAANGDLIIQTGDGEVHFQKPVVYQEQSTVGSSQLTAKDEDQKSKIENRQLLNGRYILRGKHGIGFEVASYDHSEPLIIDPVLSYSTYLGGVGQDTAFGIAVDSTGNAYVTGGTSSTNFPTTAGTFNQVSSGASLCAGGAAASDPCGDVFVTMLNPGGTAVVYSTYIGGTGDDIGYGITIDSTGNAYVVGLTNSSDFPTTAGVFQSTLGGLGGFNQGDAFALKLNSTGSTLTYSTYLGGSNNDFAQGVAVDSSGNAYITGFTCSDTNFPIHNPLRTLSTCTVGGDAFVTALNPTGASLVYSTGLGTGGGVGFGIAADSTGDVYVTGGLNGTPTFATAGAAQTTSGGSGDAFVVKINSGGSAIGYATFLGGSGGDAGTAIAIDSSGNAYVTGATKSTNFPTASPIQAVLGGPQDAFVTKLNAAGSALTYSTYLGGSGGDVGNGIAVDSLGQAYVAGGTASSNFPLASPIQAALGGAHNAFVANLNAAGSALVFSTYLGGSEYDSGSGIAVDSSGNVYIAGQSLSNDFPVTSGVFQSTYSGMGDAFVAKISPSNVPGVILNPPTLTFASQAQGTTSAAQIVTLRNVGSGALTLSVVASGDFAQINTCGATVAAGASCTISVTFTPTVSGPESGAITITDNAAGTPHIVTLSGTGSIAISLFPSSLTFSNQPVGTTSLTQIVSMTNSGPTPVTISSILAGSSTFSQSNNCGPVLAAQSTCYIDISFTPTTIGTVASNLTVTDSAAGSPEVVTLQGQGIAMELSTQNLYFYEGQPLATTSPAQTVVLANTTGSPVTISSIIASAEFAQTNNCPAILPAKSGCTISVTFTPTATGYQFGTITITDISPDSPQVINLTGLGGSAVVLPSVSFSPTSVNFSPQTINTTSAPIPVTMTNLTAGPFTITSILASAGFAQTNNCGASLAAGASCTLNITFTPSAVGYTSGTVTVTDSAPGSPHILSLSGQGLVMTLSNNELFFQGGVGVTTPSQPVILTNTGATTVSITSIVTVGDFAQTNNCGASLGAGISCTINVTYTATALGSASGYITINDSAPDSPQFIYLSGLGTSVVLSPSPLTFSAQSLGTTSSSLPITLTNETGANLAITNITISGDFAQVNDCGTSVPANSTCTISVTFTPSATGFRSGTLTVTDGALDSPHTATLEGTGAVILLSPSPLFFSSQGLGTTSAAQSITLTNTSASTVGITSIAVTSGTFAQTNTCGSSVGPGGICFINITFTPTEDGQEYGAITITDTASDSPQVAQLLGNGITLSLSPTSIFFASQTINTTSAAQTLTVTNVTNSPVSIYGVSAIDIGLGVDFAATNNCGATLGVGASCTLGITFHPAALGTRYQYFYLADSAADTPQSVFVEGTGAAASGSPILSLVPPSLTFPSQAVGTPSTPQAIVVTNTGTASATIGTVSLTGTNASDFSISGDTCTSATVAIGAHCTFSITFTPSATGPRSAQASIPSNAPASPQIATLSGTGGTGPAVSLSTSSLTFTNQSLGTTSPAQTISLTNTGGTALNITSIVPSGDFAEIDNCFGRVAARASCVLSITFTPTAVGTRSGSITLTDDASPGTQIIALSGTGVLSGVTLSASSVTFPNQGVGTTSAAQTVTLTNTGRAPLPITSIVPSGDFAVINNCGTAVAGGASCDLSITFTPTAAGARSGSITITDGTTPTSQIITLSGTGVSATFTLSASSLTFPNQAEGTTSATQTVTLANTGTSPLVITSIVASSDFAVTSNCGATVAGGANCVLTITFTPTALGARTGTITITDNATPPTQIITLTGIGTAPSQLTLSPTTLSLPGTHINQTCTPGTVTVSNVSSIALTLSSIVTAGPFVVSANTCPLAPATLAPGATCTVGVTYEPTAVATQTGTLTIASNASNGPNTTGLTAVGLPDCFLAPNSSAAAVLRGLNTTTFVIAHQACSATGPVQLSCSNQSPAVCSFNPQVLTSPDTPSTLTVSNLQALTSDLKFDVHADATLEHLYTGLAVELMDFQMASAAAIGTVNAGQTASYALAVEPQHGLQGTVTFTCQGAPAGATCSLTPQSVTLTGSGVSDVTVNVSTTARSLLAPARWRSWPPAGSPISLMFLIALAMLAGLANWPRARRKARSLTAIRLRVALLAAGLIIAMVLTWGACGGGSVAPMATNLIATPSGTYTLTVTGTYTASGSNVQIVHNSTIIMTVH